MVDHKLILNDDELLFLRFIIDEFVTIGHNINFTKRAIALYDKFDKEYNK